MVEGCTVKISPKRAKADRKDCRSKDSFGNPSPLSAGRDRRKYPRMVNPPIVVQILGTISRVKDVSASGLQIEKTFAWPAGAAKAVVSLTVYRVTGDRLDLNHSLRLTGRLVRDGEREVGIRLDPITLRLVRLIVDSGAYSTVAKSKS
jgi:hypothetical protein